MLAFRLYTGCREVEPRRAEVADLKFGYDRAKPEVRITGTKTEGSDRLNPLYPHLAEIMRAHRSSAGKMGGLLFTTEAGEPVGDWRETLDRIAARVGYEAGAVRTRRFRTSYVTHRCPCDGGPEHHQA